jgi:hypothetical protein
VLDNGSLVLIVFGGGKNCEKNGKLEKKNWIFLDFFLIGNKLTKKLEKLEKNWKKIGKKLKNWRKKTLHALGYLFGCRIGLDNGSLALIVYGGGKIQSAFGLSVLRG